MININEMSVLITDDMQNMINSIRRMMKILGYGKYFLTANNGEEAWKILQREPVDLALVDYNMPMMSGVELLKEIREDRVLRDMPVIMITAQAYQEFVAEAGESDTDAYILKPVTVKVLEEKVSTVVENANNPSPMVFHLKLAREYEEDGNIDDAIEMAKLAMEANPKASRPIRELGYYYFKKNDFDEAERWLIQASNMNTLDVFAFHYLGELYLQKNDIEKASTYFERAMRISPRHLSRGINFGKTLVERNMINKAIKVFEKTFELADNPIPFKEEIADFCIEKEAYKFAAKLLESIIRDLPNRKELFYKLGSIFEKLGDLKKTIYYLVQAEASDKENVDIKLDLARAYLALRKPIMAERPLKEVLKLNPENTFATELLRQC